MQIKILYKEVIFMKKFAKGLAALVICGSLTFGLNFASAEAAEVSETTSVAAGEVAQSESISSELTLEELSGKPSTSKVRHRFPPPPPPPPPHNHRYDRHHHYGPPPPPPRHHRGYGPRW